MSTVSSVAYKGHKWAKIQGKILGSGHKCHKCATCGALFTEASKRPVKNYTCGKRHVKGKYVYRYIPLTLEQNKAWEELVEEIGKPSVEVLERFVEVLLKSAYELVEYKKGVEKELESLVKA